MRSRLSLAGMWLALGLALCLVQACLAKQCHEVGCQSGVTATIHSIDTDDIRIIRACLDGDCTELSWTAAQGCTSTNGASPNLSACLIDSDSLELRVLERDVHDGDVLSVRVEGKDAVLLEDERTLVYKDHYPNGKDCPGRCRVATAEL